MEFIIKALSGYVEPSATVILLIALIAIWVFVRIVNEKDNPVRSWHFIASKGTDGKQYGDLNKIGVWVGIIGSTGIVCWYGYYLRLEWWMFLFWLAFIAAVETYARWLRSVLGKESGKIGKK